MTGRRLLAVRPFLRALGWTPTAAQWGPLLSRAKVRIFVAGRRTGKTATWAVEAVRVLASGAYCVWVVGPSHELVKRAWDAVAVLTWRARNAADRALWSPESKAEAPGVRRVVFPWGAQIVGLSAEQPDKSLLGEGVHLLWLTEAARLRRVVWEEYLLPTIADTGGAVVADTTPRGDNWLREQYEIGQDPSRPDTESWRVATWTNTARFPGGRSDPKIVLLEQQLSRAAFAQEIEASFVTFRGRLLPEFDRDVHGFRGPRPIHPGKLLGGIDWGYTHPAALVVAGYDSADRAVVLDEYVSAGRRTAELVEAAHDLQRRVGGQVCWYAGPDQPQSIAEFLAGGLECFPADNEHRGGIDLLGSLMKPRPGSREPAFRIDLDRCPVTARALEVAHYRERRGEFGDEFDDEQLDPVDALRYALYSDRPDSCADFGVATAR